MSEGEGTSRRRRPRRWPTDTFFTARNDLYFNGEAVQMLHQPNAHTDGDVIVYFRKSDVIVAGDVYVNTTFPVINLQQGGSLDGIVAALNRIIEITVPKDKQEGGTYVIPGHGRLADEADVVEYRDMVDDHPRPLSGCDQEGHDARAGEGGAAAFATTRAATARPRASGRRTRSSRRRTGAWHARRRRAVERVQR